MRVAETCRRHQKVIEEAPAPGMDEATRAELCAAAVRAAKAVNYEGAGTIEFIADASQGLRADRIWFMEMNTRLQVEHPVTEEITGVDLVEWQLRVAAGEAIPLKQEELSINGWAMEARLYAEDVAAGFLPSTGRLEQCHLPDDDDDVRVETGFEKGSVISPYYDPMIAKLIAHGSSRDDATYKLGKAIEGVAVWPVKSNAGFLFDLVTHSAFADGNVTTSFIADHHADLEPMSAPNAEMLGQAARELVNQYEDEERRELAGFRLNAPPRKTVRMRHDNQRYEIVADDEFGGHTYSSRAAPDIALVSYRADSFALALDHERGGSHHSAHDGDILSPMPGKIIAVEVAAGDAVTKGQKLLTLEAMKMEHTLTAPFDGVVAELNAAPGAQVQVEALLARIEASE
jgi:3-methylcrotonyl-CoA carboxylase alpha subunit